MKQTFPRCISLDQVNGNLIDTEPGPPLSSVSFELGGGGELGLVAVTQVHAGIFGDSVGMSHVPLCLLSSGRNFSFRG